MDVRVICAELMENPTENIPTLNPLHIVMQYIPLCVCVCVFECDKRVLVESAQLIFFPRSSLQHQRQRQHSRCQTLFT